MRRLGALVLVLLLAGCARPDVVEPEPVGPASVPEPVAVPAFALVAQPVPDLAVTLEVADRWVTPLQDVVARATAPGARFSWFVQTRNPLATVPDAGPFVIPPGVSASVPAAGAARHVYALDGSDALLNVSLIEGALPLAIEVRLVVEGGVARFAPEEIVAGRGSRLTILNDLGAIATLRHVAAMTQVPASDDAIAFRMRGIVDELGDYDLVVVGRDGSGAVGEARARLIYDNRKPDENVTFAFRGSFPFAGTRARDNGTEVDHGFTNAHRLRSLDVRITKSTDAPLPMDLRVTLLDAGLTAIASTEGDGFVVTDLPRGDYGLRVDSRSGALVEYQIVATGVWDLQPPASFFNRAG